MTSTDHSDAADNGSNGEATKAAGTAKKARAAEAADGERNARMDRLFELLEPFMRRYGWRTLMDENGGDTAFDAKDKRQEWRDFLGTNAEAPLEPEMPHAKRIICLSPEPNLKMLCIVPKIDGFRIHTLVVQNPNGPNAQESVDGLRHPENDLSFRYEYSHYDVKGEAKIVILYLMQEFSSFLSRSTCLPHEAEFASLRDDGFTIHFQNGHSISQVEPHSAESLYYYLTFATDPRWARAALDQARKLDSLTVNPELPLSFSPEQTGTHSFSLCPPNRGQLCLCTKIHESQRTHEPEYFTFETAYVHKNGTFEYIDGSSEYTGVETKDLPSRTRHADAVRRFSVLAVLMQSAYEMADRLGIGHDANLEDVVLGYVEKSSAGMDHMWDVIDHAVTRRRDMATLSTLLDERGFETTEMPHDYEPADRDERSGEPYQPSSAGGILITPKDESYGFHYYLEQPTDGMSDCYHCHRLSNDRNVRHGFIQVHGIDTIKLFLIHYLDRTNPHKPVDDPYGEPDHRTLKRKIERYCEHNEGDYDDLAQAPDFLDFLVEPEYYTLVDDDDKYSLGKDRDKTVCLRYAQTPKYGMYWLSLVCMEGDYPREYGLEWNMPKHAAKADYLLAFTMQTWHLRNLHRLASRIGVDMSHISCHDIAEILAPSNMPDHDRDSDAESDDNKTESGKTKTVETKTDKPGGKTNTSGPQTDNGIDISDTNEDFERCHVENPHDMAWLVGRLQSIFTEHHWQVISDPATSAPAETISDTTDIRRIICLSPGRKPFFITISIYDSHDEGDGHVRLSYALPHTEEQWQLRKIFDTNAYANLHFSSVDQALLFIIAELMPQISLNGLSTKSFSGALKSDEGYEIILCDGRKLGPLPLREPESIYLYLSLTSDPATASRAQQEAQRIDTFISDPQVVFDFLRDNVDPRHFSFDKPKPGAFLLKPSTESAPSSTSAFISSTNATKNSAATSPPSSGPGDTDSAGTTTDANQNGTATYNLAYYPLHSQTDKEDAQHLTLLKGANRTKAVCRMALLAYRLQQILQVAQAQCITPDTFTDGQTCRIVTQTNETINLVSRWIKVAEQLGKPLDRLNQMLARHEWRTLIRKDKPLEVEMTYSKNWPDNIYHSDFVADPDDPEGIICRIQSMETDRGFWFHIADAHTLDEVAAKVESEIERSYPAKAKGDKDRKNRSATS